MNSFADLKGKRVNVGNPGSGQRATMEVVMDAYGIGMDDFALATEYKGSEMAKQLCDGNIDAMIYTIGHPAAAIKEATTTCDANLVSVTGPEIDKLVADNPFYRVATIPGGMYKGTDEDTTTFGVGATFVTSADDPRRSCLRCCKIRHGKCRRLPQTAPCICQPGPGRNGQRRSQRSAAPWCGESLQGTGPEIRSA